VDAWFYYLATDDYASAPHKKPEGGGQDGTAAPVDKSFKSPFVGRSVTDVAAWLKRKPEGIDLESRFFAVLDKKARDGSVVLCKIGDSDDKGDKVTCVLRDADESSLTLAGIEWGDWEDLLSDGGEYTPEV